jgi:hypothetical protein
MSSTVNKNLQEYLAVDNHFFAKHAMPVDRTHSKRKFFSVFCTDNEKKTKDRAKLSGSHILLNGLEAVDLLWILTATS